MQNKYCSNQEESSDPLFVCLSNSQYFGANLRTAGDNPMFNVKGNSKMKRFRDNFSWMKHGMERVSNLVPKVPFWIWNLKQSTQMAMDIGTVPVRPVLVTLWTCKG